ncbi:MAG: SynChlorMet cassette radical SAM/SPASM protein ScmF [Dehalobacter sp.]|nr:SynChlorMet cassette radical SAM/SPASM protein ScmF [Dehalobacter sp.]
MVSDDLCEKAERKYPLNQIYFYLTADCNLRCRHCWIAPAFQSSTVSNSYIPVDLFKKIVKEGKPLGLSNVKLTGGEPLLHPRILEILTFIREEGLSLGVETNGVLCTPEVARAIAACGNVYVSISLDGVDAETHEWVRGVDGCFEDALAGIRNLVSVGIRPQIIMSVMRKNRDQMEPMVRLAESLGANSVKFNVVVPTERAEQLYEAGEAMGIEDFVKLGHWVEHTLSKSSSIPLHYSHPIAFRSLGNMIGRSYGCGICNILGIIGVLADGTYALCGIGENVPELTCGNAANVSLKDAWENASFLCELRKGLPDRLEGVCGECINKKTCFGGCIAQNYYRSKSLWAPYWYCDEAMKKGLFPASRLLKSFTS